MRRIKALRDEWRARRQGAKYLPREIFRAARDIAGPTGTLWSNGWRRVEEDGDAYLRSFDPRIPPSLHVSHRDRTRLNQPIPLPERCIEDWSAGPDSPDA